MRSPFQILLISLQIAHSWFWFSLGSLSSVAAEVQAWSPSLPVRSRVEKANCRLEEEMLLPGAELSTGRLKDGGEAGSGSVRVCQGLSGSVWVRQGNRNF